MSSGATTSAGRAKKDWERCWEGLGGYGSGFEAYSRKLQRVRKPNYLKSMKVAKSFLTYGAAVFVLSGTPSVAQDAVLDVRGCGTGCRIETTQLSAPSWMADGWAKVLERSAMYIVDINGREEKYFRGQPLPAVEQYWVFAKCNDKWFGQGFKSDGSDARTVSIYDESGNPKSYTASANIYDRHKKLCNSLR